MQVFRLMQGRQAYLTLHELLMHMPRPFLDCGPPALETGLFSSAHLSGGALALFAGRHATFTYMSRVAIRRACDLLGLAPGDEVLAPGYNCGSELDALRNAGLSIRLYPVNLDTQIDPDAVEARIGPRTRAIYVTHYFGFLQLQLAALRALCDRHGLYLIEDCALSLLSGSSPADGRTGDVAVFCFYKFFPVIGGGALVINRDLPGDPAPLRTAPAGQVIRRLLMQGVKSLVGTEILETTRTLRSRLRGRSKSRDLADSKVVATETELCDMPKHYYFDSALRDRRLSNLTRRALDGQDISEAIRRRRENYMTLLGLIDGIAGARRLHSDLPTDACPLNLPVLVPQRDAVVRRLVSEGIAAVPWWAGYNRHLNWDDVGDTRYLKENLLTLPIDQRLESDHLNHIAARFTIAMRDAG
jgi:perosamine synthetase